MTPLPPTPVPVIRCDLHWAVEGDATALTRIFLQYTGGPPSAADLTTLADRLVSQGDTNLGPMCGTFIGMTGATCTRLDGGGGPQGEGGTAWVGTRTGDRLSPGTAALVNLPIGRLYRGGKPRNYWPCGTGTDVATTGLWADAFVTAMDAAILDYLSGLEGFVFGSCTISQQVSVSYYDGFEVIISPTTGRARNMSKKRTVPVVDAILAWNTSKTIASQRRRNRNA